MKVVVMNYTGTVGKTTIASHLLLPRINNSSIIAVESFNESAAGIGIKVDQIKADKFKEIFRKIIDTDAPIIDVGTSNIENFLNGMTRFSATNEEIDFFVIPVTSGTKEQRETISMIMTLKEFGIPDSKIRLIFNRVESNVEEEFLVLLNYTKKNNIPINNKALIFESELFDELAIKKMTIKKLQEDNKDYRALLRENKEADQKQRDHWIDMYGLKCLAKHVSKNLDDCFAELFG
ncbi:StbB family protein [Methylicorpusculum sp.]|uniref:StbB family protein n=2 Tax=Methylicorpusculum sp. TaxID=2713644 RepID=UPI002719E32B|nr:StbB family protein [Methylicorpusculum sp.]MDO8845585.1 StbB family protein [Methylicorpusculum sp.]